MRTVYSVMVTEVSVLWIRSN